MSWGSSTILWAQREFSFWVSSVILENSRLRAASANSSTFFCVAQHYDAFLGARALLNTATIYNEIDF